MLRFGYASQNLTLGATTGRTLRLANLGDADKVRSIVRANLADLELILRWNAEHDIGLFRLSQQLIPFASHPTFPYDWQCEHEGDLRRVGGLARMLGIRLSLHPGQFIQPGSPTREVRARSLEELRYVARLLTFLGGEASTLVLHLGGAYGDKESASRNFEKGIRGEDEVLRYLALENDERIWSVSDVVGVAEALGIPAIVDTLHHALNSGTWSLDAALARALPTWSARPKVHLSSQDVNKQHGAHAACVDAVDFFRLRDALHGCDVDIMVEAKAKEAAVTALQSLVPAIST